MHQNFARAITSLTPIEHIIERVFESLKLLLNPRLRLRRDTSPDQLYFYLSGDSFAFGDIAGNRAREEIRPGLSNLLQAFDQLLALASFDLLNNQSHAQTVI